MLDSIEIAFLQFQGKHQQQLRSNLCPYTWQFKQTNKQKKNPLAHSLRYPHPGTMCSHRLPLREDSGWSWKYTVEKVEINVVNRARIELKLQCERPGSPAPLQSFSLVSHEIFSFNMKKNIKSFLMSTEVALTHVIM